MKISLNWLKKYVEVPVSDAELIRLIGARLVEVEGVIDETHKYDKIYVVKVVSCEKIPDTHLTLCHVNVGQALSGHASARPVVTGEPRSSSVVTSGRSREGLDTTLIQVVCGAPNVREGMLAVWIAPGAIVPASVHEDAPFVIGKRKMRGYESNGMLAGADELDFGDDHSGIVEVDPESAKPGDLLSDVFELNDLVLEIENKSLTHRPDCFGIIGFAREVAGILGRQFEYDFSRDGVPRAHRYGARTPHTSVVTSGSPRKVYSELPIDITIDDSNICSRYSAVVLEKHGELKPKYLTWVDTVLAKSGMKPINPVVDATNYLMLLTGQPLHAFDYDKFVAVGGTNEAEIRVRLARKGEKLVLLDEKEVELNENDIVICSGEVPVALAGAMGGMSTCIDENTRKIILESATFSLYNLRKTQMAHGIFSEAITRFTKGQPSYQTLTVAEACAEMLAEGFKVVSVADEYPKPEVREEIVVGVDEINGLLGTEYSEELIVKTLSNVGFEIKTKHGKLSIKAPAWRMDIHIKEDIIEEVGRLLGYDNIQPTLPLHRTADKNAMWELKRRVRAILAKYGGNELLTYSFVSGKLMERVGQKTTEAYKIVNSISPDLQYVRQSIVPSLLEKAYVNQKKPVEKFAIFEMNEVYRKVWGNNDEGVPAGKTALGLVLAERKNRDTAYYKAKKYVAKLLEELGVKVQFVPFEKSEEAEMEPFEPKRAAKVMSNDGAYLGVVGEFKNSVRNEFKLAPYLAGFEIVSLEEMMNRIDRRKKVDLTLRKSEDLTVTTDKTYAETLAEVQAKYPEAKISPLSIYQAPGQKTKNISFRIWV